LLMIVHAYAAQKPSARLEPYLYEAAEPGPEEVLVKVSHCGICHSDLHLIDNDWNASVYPLVPGHEVIGTVAAAGSRVTHLKPGQRVGIGWQSGSCGTCEWCLSGQEQLCGHGQDTCVGKPGGFATYVTAHSRFAIPVPEALDPATAAPLLCGGITVYSPLRYYGLRPHQHVGVVGIGGLGHLALQFAAAFGARVTALSSSPDKALEARDLGADEFLPWRDESARKAARSSFDMLLVTATADMPWSDFMQLLRPNGRLIIVSGADSRLNIPIGLVVIGRKMIGGSVIGPPAEIAEMLNFAARNGIAAKTEVMPLDRVNEALDKVRNNMARYRMVLSMPE